MSKCICLVNRIPIVSAAEHILMAIHSIFTSNVQPPPLPLESYIYWILNEVCFLKHFVSLKEFNLLYNKFCRYLYLREAVH